MEDNPYLQDIFLKIKLISESDVFSDEVNMAIIDLCREKNKISKCFASFIISTNSINIFETLANVLSLNYPNSIYKEEAYSDFLEFFFHLMMLADSCHVKKVFDKYLQQNCHTCVVFLRNYLNETLYGDLPPQLVSNLQTSFIERKLEGKWMKFSINNLSIRTHFNLSSNDNIFNETNVYCVEVSEVSQYILSEMGRLPEHVWHKPDKIIQDQINNFSQLRITNILSNGFFFAYLFDDFHSKLLNIDKKLQKCESQEIDCLCVGKQVIVRTPAIKSTCQFVKDYQYVRGYVSSNNGNVAILFLYDFGIEVSCSSKDVLECISGINFEKPIVQLCKFSNLLKALDCKKLSTVLNVYQKLFCKKFNENFISANYIKLFSALMFSQNETILKSTLDAYEMLLKSYHQWNKLSSLDGLYILYFITENQNIADIKTAFRILFFYLENQSEKIFLSRETLEDFLTKFKKIEISSSFQREVLKIQDIISGYGGVCESKMEISCKKGKKELASTVNFTSKKSVKAYCGESRQNKNSDNVYKSINDLNPDVKLLLGSPKLGSKSLSDYNLNETDENTDGSSFSDNCNESEKKVNILNPKFSPTDNFYIYNHLIMYSNDQTHQLINIHRLKDIAIVTIVSQVCGMLNSGLGGNIYIGIDPENSLIKGTKMDRESRDEFRIEINTVVKTKLSPACVPSLISTEFVPVVREANCRNGLAYVSNDHDLYVIQLNVGSINNLDENYQFYFVNNLQGKSDVMYLRVKGENTQLNDTEIRERVSRLQEQFLINKKIILEKKIKELVEDLMQSSVDDSGLEKILNT